MEFVIATQNKGKLAEMRRMLEPLGHTVLSAKEAGFTQDVEETGATFAENAALKAAAVAQAVGKPVIADDSGLMVDALDGAPGVYSARYAGEGATDQQRWEKLLLELKDVPQDKRSAKFCCAIVLVLPGQQPITFSGECPGYIGPAPLGEDGFGYDPVFYLNETTSFATLSGEEKDQISHRGRAMAQLEDYLKNFPKKERKNHNSGGKNGTDQ